MVLVDNSNLVESIHLNVEFESEIESISFSTDFNRNATIKCVNGNF